MSDKKYKDAKDLAFIKLSYVQFATEVQYIKVLEKLANCCFRLKEQTNFLNYTQRVEVYLDKMDVYSEKNLNLDYVAILKMKYKQAVSLK